MSSAIDPQLQDPPVQGEVRHGDAYDLMGALAPASIDLVITSPPYWGLRTYGQEHNAEILREWLAEEPDAIHGPPYEQGSVIASICPVSLCR